MGTSTITITANMAAPARKVHAGLNVVAFKMGAVAAFGTAADAIALCKIPNKAILTRIDGLADNGATTMNYMLKLKYTEGNGSSTVVTVSPSITILTRMSLTAPVKVSISDDQAVQYATLLLVVTTGASASVSTSVVGVVEYFFDEGVGF